jgi:hypothetical protein
MNQLLLKYCMHFWDPNNYWDPKDVLFYVFFVLFYVFSCCMNCLFCVVFCIVGVCTCVLYYCHRVATQLELNVSYHVRSLLTLTGS